MKLSVVTTSMEKKWRSPTQVVGLGNWTSGSKKINTPKETVMLLKYEPSDEVHPCPSQHWPTFQTPKKPISALPLSL